MGKKGSLNYESDLKCTKCNGNGKSLTNPGKLCGYCKGTGVKTK